ncbi:family 43 glycosylhydrolase [Paenibacillus hexagrammi]|uniref:Family 43 glycosylhydrolase n=1 Tax=Paenibacillus hexagrammi TaxID=2908839 RepID=A0ABY3SBP2_9BACL|nr:family 43 glycosylhydrolase [Paenibacillus sp. YPD9-1]UJF31414.1 family 43 glycosylhydrolase [Paenibacillus sp. YPD9-1]
MKRFSALVLAGIMLLGYSPGGISAVKAAEVRSGSALAAASLATTAESANLLAHYPLLEDLKDTSGNGKDGEAVGNVTFSDGLTLPGGTNSSTNYVKLPDGLFDNQNSVTISSWIKSNTPSGNYSALFFGTKANASKVPENYWLFNPTNPSGKFKSVFTNSVSSSAPWGMEVGVTATDTTVNRGVWAHYTTVISPTSITGYMNGTKIGTVSKTRTTSDFGTGLNAYIGRSNYLNDYTFAGSFQDLRIYGEAMDDNGVAAIYKDAHKMMSLQLAEKSLSLGDTSSVTSNLTLPSTGSNGTSITWSSSNEEAVSNTGVVTLSNVEQTVTLTAVISLDGSQVTKDFTVVLVSAEHVTQIIADKLYIPYVLTQADQLPSSIEGASITWSSSDSSIIGNDGSMNPPAAGMAEVDLTAAVTFAGKQVTKDFHVQVMESSPSFILSYTRSGSSVVTDALHLGYSADGSDYTALNNNTGVLFAKADYADGIVGVTKKLVHPYVFRMKDGTFGVVGSRYNTAGSQTDAEKSSVLLFTSPDLVTFTEAGLVSLQTDKTVTAPVCEFDASALEYRIEWKDADGISYFNTTKDFVTVSQPASGSKIAVKQASASIASALPVDSLPVTKAEAKVITNKLAKVMNTAVSGLDIEVQSDNGLTFDELSSKKVTASYNDGSTAEKAVNWNQDQFNQIDFSQPGVYTVGGTVKQTAYPKDMIPQYADPNVLLYNGKYYFIATNENGQMNLNMREADTILGLKDAASTTIWSANASGDMSGSIWAPELHIVGQDLYIFFAAGSPAAWNTVQSRVMKLKTGGNPMSPSDWETPVRVLNKDGSYLYTGGITLDMTYFEQNGESYLIWAQRLIGSPNGSSDLYIAKTSEQQPWKLTTDPVRISRPEYGWERWTTEVDEGPFVLQHGNQVFVTFSASGVNTTYSIGLLSANKDSDLLNPASWTKLPYPLLNSESVPGEYGPGHNSYTVDEDGNTVNIYHTIPASGGKRNMNARRVHWAADGTPVLDMVPEREILPANQTVTATITVTDSGEGVASHAGLHGTDSVNGGQPFELTYGLSNVDGDVYAEDVTVSYNAEQVEFIGAESLRDHVKIAAVSEQATSQGQVRIIAALIGEDRTVNGDAIRLNWKAKELASDAAATISLSQVVIADGLGAETELSGQSHVVQIHALDKSRLSALLAEAQVKHDAAIEGTEAGQYPAGSKAALQVAIDRAKAVAENPEATQQQVEQAVTDLTAALQTFIDSVHHTQPGDTNGDGRYSVGDLAIVAAAYGKTLDDPNWSEYQKGDLNQDGKIDIEDLAAMARKILE